MTKRDYEVLANSIKASVDMHKGHNIKTQAIRDTVEILATALKLDNNKFDRARFFKACGLGE